MPILDAYGTITPDGKHLLLADPRYNLLLRVPVRVALATMPHSRQELMTPPKR